MKVTFTQRYRYASAPDQQHTFYPGDIVEPGDKPGFDLARARDVVKLNFAYEVKPAIEPERKFQEPVKRRRTRAHKNA
jgi:hypothetical protein